MTFINLPNVGTLTFDAARFVMDPTMSSGITGDVLTHALRGYLKRSRSRNGLSRRVMRKTSNRKRRWFVDNIIMHHKRLHDRNRAIVVSNARTRALAKREALKRKPIRPRNSDEAMKNEFRHSHHSSSSSLKDKAKSLRGRVDAKRVRARSRWLSAVESSN